MTFALNDQQTRAVSLIDDWWRHKDPEPFLLQGYAGTGKTTIVKDFTPQLGVRPSRIAFVAPTNRAAKVLSNKTGVPVRTLHSFLYSTQEEEIRYHRLRFRVWREASNFSQLIDLLVVDLVKNAKDEYYMRCMEDGFEPDEKQLEQFIEGKRETALVFEGLELPEDPAVRLTMFGTLKNEKLAYHKAEIDQLSRRPLQTIKRSPDEIKQRYDIVVCDESSMVSKKQGRDLLDVGLPVIFVGDPFQLPPVKEKCIWDGMDAQITLTKIERQKGLGAGIPLSAQEIRLGRKLTANDSVGLWRRNELPQDSFLEYDQILCGTHKTRERLCEFVRHHRGLKTPHAVEGEKIVAVFNDKKRGIMNGELYTVKDSQQMRGGTVTLMTLEDPYGVEIPDVPAWTQGFAGRSATNYLDDEYGKFWFGYAITVHQSQGSEWPRVILCDDWGTSDRDRWLYTGVTRASQKIEVING